jgi:hypothetical protein
MRVVVAALCCSPLLGPLACFPLERGDGLGSGAIHLTVVDRGGAPIAGARISVDGAPHLATSDAEGAAVLTDVGVGDSLVRIAVDDDGDGITDRGALVPDAGVTVGDFSRGAFLGTRQALTSLVLGEVFVDDTVALRGRVEGCAPLTCRVVVVHHLDFGATSPRSAQGVVEATARVDDDGAWRLSGIVPGRVSVVALQWDASGAAGPVAQGLAASRAVAAGRADRELVAATGSTDVDVGTLSLAALPATLPATLAVGGLDAEGLVRASGLLTFTAPSTAAARTDVAPVTIDGLDASGLLTFEAPPGVVDIGLTLDDGTGGVLRGALVVPGLTALASVQAGVFACGTQTEAGADCDDDGLAAGDDDDDDGDGQPDADETPPCRGVGRGTDRDGDCLCEPFDPLPDCTSNDPSACATATPVVCPDVF